MTHTTVSFTPQQIENLVGGHYGNKPVESWSKYQQNIIQGGGSLLSSMDDQLLYLEVQMGLTTSALSPAILLTQEKSFPYSGRYSDYVGLGWSHLSEGGDIFWKNGGNGAYNSFMGFDRRAKTGVVILVNSSLNPEAFSTFSGFEILKVLNRYK
jgi:CubicO group peptidase (beta-lactamase class C family)